MLERRLIVNADDFGWSEGVNEGIVEAHRNGIVTSATLAATGPAAEHAVRLAAENPELGVGVHLAYGLGRSLVEPRRLSAIYHTDGRARFGVIRLWLAVRLSRVARDQLYQHFASQVRWLLDHGTTPTHLDTHKHLHFCPVIGRMVCRIAEEFSIPAVRALRERWWTGGGQPATRVKLAMLSPMVLICNYYIKSSQVASADRFVGISWTGSWTKQGLLDILDRLSPGTTELMVHPGYACGLASDETRLTGSRETELELLTDREVIERCRLRNIRLISYRELSMDRPPHPASGPSKGRESR